MGLRVYSTSSSFQAHMKRVLDCSFDLHEKLPETKPPADDICLLHISSLELTAKDCLRQLISNADSKIGVCSDNPSIAEMLGCVEAGAKAYCNSYMQASGYQQLLRLIANGQSWFPPQLLSQTFALAQQSINGKDTESLLGDLTRREKQVALAVSEGLSNREISAEFEISERTVKSHLTNIFAKLNLRDRVSLALFLK